MSGKKLSRNPRTLDADVLTLARERMAHLYDNYDHVAVMFSGGKDSTAVLNVALDVANADPRHARHLPLRVIFFDEEAIPQETADYVARVAARPDVALEWYCLPVQHRNACSRTSPYWWPWAPEAEAKWCRPLPAQAITSLRGFQVDPPEARLSIPECAKLLFPPELGRSARVLGIRAQESLIRHRAVTRKSNGENWIIDQTAGVATKAYPVYDWRTEDVWTAPALLGWDYNHAYDLMEMAGVSHSMQRCSPAFGEEPLQKLWTYASCFPDVWEKMVDRVPGVGAAARYALTELYSYQGRPVKPEDQTWPDFILHYVDKFDAKSARMIRHRLRALIREHYGKTTDPILEKAVHPATGVSWTFLLTIAMRGDFKHRKQAGGNVRGDDQGRAAPALWIKYVTELEELIADGRFDQVAWPGRGLPDVTRIVPDYAKETA